MNPMYSNALSGLAAGMAGGGGAPMGGGMPSGMGEAESEMVPCPLCQGTGMVPADMMGGEPMLPLVLQPVVAVCRWAVAHLCRCPHRLARRHSQ